MKISLLTSTSASGIYKEYYSLIITYLVRRGHSVSHILSVNEDMRLTDSEKEKRENIYFNFYQDIKESDLVIAECSYTSIDIIYEISHALRYGKEVIILRSEESRLRIKNEELLSYDNKTHTYTYDRTNLLTTLKEAIQLHSPKKYRKFNVLFSPAMVAKLDLISRKRNLPKSVYIRELIEKSLTREEIE